MTCHMRDVWELRYMTLIEWIIYKTIPGASEKDYGWLWARGWCE